MRPFEGDACLWIEFLEQMLDEGAHSIHATIHGVQPQSMFGARVVRVHLEVPIFDHVHKGFGEVGREFIALLREAGFMGQIEGVLLFRFIRQVEDQTEVGVVIGPVLPFVQVDG